MKKRLTLICILIALVLILCSCSILPAATLEHMFSPQNSTQQSGSSYPQNDTVVISRAEYEKYKQFSEMTELIDIIDSEFYEEPDHEKMMDTAAEGVMAALDDPYTFYYTPEEFQAMLEDDEGNYVGIGVYISADYTTQLCTISRVFEGSPAQEAGVLRGDILYKVEDDLLVTADNLQEAVNIMRGVPGTEVNVTFLRDGQEMTFNMIRKEVSVNQIESGMLDEQTGYIALYQFAGHCEEEFEKALNNLMDQGSKGIILDLRDNGGGWVEQARYIADFFMDEGELLYLVYRNGKEVHTEFLTTNGKVDQKIVILVNELSASASEILTGALRERAGATVVGTQTFGKGIVQNVHPIGSRGAGCQITVAQYFTPNGYAVHKNGITPDILIEIPEGDTGMYDFADLQHDVQLKKAYEVMQEILKEE